MVIDGGVPQDDVLADAAIEQDHILRQHADAPAQLRGRQLAQVHVPEFDAALLRLVKTGQQLGQGAFARSHGPDDADPVAGIDAQAYILKGQTHGIGIGERNVLHGEGGLQLAKIHAGAFRLVLGRQLHEQVKGLQGNTRILQAGQQGGQLHQWRHGPAHKDVAADEGPHGHQAFRDPVDAPDDHAHRDQMGHQGGGRHGQTAVPARFRCRFGGKPHHGLPQALHPALGLAGLDGLQAVDHLHEQGILLHVLLVALLGAAARRGLEEEPQPDEDGHGRQRQEDHGPGDEGDQQQEDDQEGDVDAGQQRGRAEKFAQLLEFTQVIDQRARGFRFAFQPHGEDLVHQIAGEHDVCIAPGHVHEVRAQGPQQKVEQVDDDHAGGQDPQRLYGIVGHDPVIDVHGEQGAGQRDEVDDDAGQRHMAVDGRIIAQHVPEPAFALGQTQFFHMFLRTAGNGHIQGIAGVFFLQRVQGHQLAGAFRLRKDDFGPGLAGTGFARLSPCRSSRQQPGQDTATVAGQQQDAGQGQVGEVCQPGTIQHAARQARLAGDPQARLGRDRTARKPGQQELGRQGLAPEPAQGGKTAQQRRHEIDIGGPQSSGCHFRAACFPRSVFRHMNDPLAPILRTPCRKTTGRGALPVVASKPSRQIRLPELSGATPKAGPPGYLNQPISKSSPWTGRASLGPDLISSAGTPMRGSRSPARAHMR